MPFYRVTFEMTVEASNEAEAKRVAAQNIEQWEDCEATEVRIFVGDTLPRNDNENKD